MVFSGCEIDKLLADLQNIQEHIYEAGNTSIPPVLVSTIQNAVTHFYDEAGFLKDEQVTMSANDVQNLKLVSSSAEDVIKRFNDDAEMVSLPVKDQVKLLRPFQQIKQATDTALQHATSCTPFKVPLAFL